MAHPGNDFDEYVNGEWKKNTTIPDDQSRWGSFMILRDENLERLKQLCIEDTGVVGQLYKCLMEPVLERSTLVQEWVNRAASIKDHKEYLSLAGEMFSHEIVSIMHICKTEDDKDPDTYVPRIFQSGLGLPDKSYYTEREDLHSDYLKYVKFACNHYGHEIDTESFFDFEKKIADHYLTRTQLRDSELTYNKRPYTEVHDLLPEYFDSLGLPEMKDIIVSNPDHLQFLSEFLPTVKVDVLQSHLVYRIVDNFASIDTDELVNAMFEFNGKRLNGQLQIRPKWKRYIDIIDGHVGDELGKLYVEKYFPLKQQKLCVEMVDSLIEVLSDTIECQEWMSSLTKAEAQRKLSKLGTSKVGVPSKYHSIEGLWNNGVPDNPVKALLEWGQWDWRHKECALFYTKVDRELWGMTPQTVNAYYNPVLSEIVFPAGILQSPFFGDSVEENLGGIGVVIGHEMTHAFDDEGRKYNADGELKDWWTESDAKEFTARTKAVEDHYNEQTVCGEKVNGKLTLGENIADIGGLKIALRALRRHFGDRIANHHYKSFFRAYARIWRSLTRDEYARKLLKVDPHAPARCRINAALSHVQEFYDTYDVHSHHGMYLSPEKRMNIW